MRQKHVNELDFSEIKGLLADIQSDLHEDGLQSSDNLIDFLIKEKDCTFTKHIADKGEDKVAIQSSMAPNITFIGVSAIDAGYRCLLGLYIGEQVDLYGYDN